MYRNMYQSFNKALIINPNIINILRRSHPGEIPMTPLPLVNVSGLYVAVQSPLSEQCLVFAKLVASVVDPVHFCRFAKI